MNLKPRIYADTSTKPTIIDYSDLVRRIFYEGIHNECAFFVDGSLVRNKYDAYCKREGKNGIFLSIVFHGEHGVEAVTVCFDDDDELDYVRMVNLNILDKTLKQMKKTGEIHQLLGLLYL